MHSSGSLLVASVCLVLVGCATLGPGGQCPRASEQGIAALFDRWNASLQTGDPHQVVANYAARSILLPTVSNAPRLTPADKLAYFENFLKSRPSGVIDLRFVDIACNTALDAGLYTFTFGTTGQVVHARYTFTYRWEGGQWLITSHHSSAMPEAAPH
ncbi:MAG: SgcJ/EcaC family oxidoreductase [Massilia sp.]